jgi:hypothetical protein
MAAPIRCRGGTQRVVHNTRRGFEPSVSGAHFGNVRVILPLRPSSRSGNSSSRQPAAHQAAGAVHPTDRDDEAADFKAQHQQVISDLDAADAPSSWAQLANQDELEDELEAEFADELEEEEEPESQQTQFLMWHADGVDEDPLEDGPMDASALLTDDEEDEGDEDEDWDDADAVAGETFPEIQLKLPDPVRVKVVEARFEKSSVRVEDCPLLPCPEFAMIGRSNVGKSSLINMLTGRSELALTSKQPGAPLPAASSSSLLQLPQHCPPSRGQYPQH